MILLLIFSGMLPQHHISKNIHQRLEWILTVFGSNWCTPLKMNIAPEKGPSQKGKLIFQASFFRGYV